MYSISEMADRLFQGVLNQQPFFQHDSIIIVGNNTTGKSTLIKGILEKVKENQSMDFYYIDSKNRIVVDRLNQNLSINYTDFSLNSIIETRSNKDYFATLDVFNPGITGGVATFSELMSNLQDYNELLSHFMKCNLKKGSLLGSSSLVGGAETIFINDGQDIQSIASSEASKIRLVMEINYAKKLGCKAVIIDEFDSHLDNENMIEFINNLRGYFAPLRFVFVVHNFEILVNMLNIDAAIYNNVNTSPIEIQPIDCNDISELGQVYRIRSRYIGEKRTQEVILSGCVMEIVKNGILSDTCESQFTVLERSSLNSKERILYDYILEMKKHDS